MNLTPRRSLTLATTFAAWSLAAPSARADVDNPHERYHQPPSISTFHWDAVTQSDMDLRGMRATEIAADQTASTPQKMVLRPLSRVMQASRASQRPVLLGRAPKRNPTTQRGVGMVRRFVRITKGSLRDRLINSETSGNAGPQE
jgi:hypothetical protein